MNHRAGVRAPRPGEGRAIAGLWRELWDVHEAWGSYAGAKDAATYDQVAQRIDNDSRARGGNAALGRHLHLVGTLDGVPLGQVEGWVDRFGDHAMTPWTCEVRSLIVSERARGSGLGRMLLDALGHAATLLVRAPCVLVAEVLEPNPAHEFYRKVGYAPISWVARVDDVELGSRLPARPTFTARRARSEDAYALALLDQALAARRRSLGDLRFDPPHAIDATLVGALAARLEGTWSMSPLASELVAVDGQGYVRAAASAFIAPLDPPFIPVRRGIMTRVCVDPAHDPAPLLAALVPYACRIALAAGARTMEIADLTAPGTPLSNAALGAGARPWSRVVSKRHAYGA